VQAAIDEVVEVVAVRHLLVAAFLVLAGAGDGGAGGGVGGVDVQLALIDVVAVLVVQVAVVDVIDVAVVLDAGVAAVLAVDVLVAGVLLAAHGIGSPFVNVRVLRSILRRESAGGSAVLDTTWYDSVSPRALPRPNNFRGATVRHLRSLLVLVFGRGWATVLPAGPGASPLEEHPRRFFQGLGLPVQLSQEVFGLRLEGAHVVLGPAGELGVNLATQRMMLPVQGS